MKVKLIIIYLIISTPVFSQINIGFSAGSIQSSAESFFNNGIDYLNLFWKKGFAVNIQGEYFLNNSLALSPFVEFATYKFDKYYLYGPRIPEEYVRDATGENSIQWNLFLTLKIFPPIKKIVKLAFITGIGYSFESLGKITAYFGYLGKGETKREFRLKRDNRILHLLGLSLRAELMSSLSVEINGSFYTNYKDRFYPTIKAGFISRIPDIF